MIFGGTPQTVLSISVSSRLKLPSRNYFKVLISLTAILSGHFNRHRWGPPIFMKSSKLVCRAAIFVQTVSFMHKLSKMRQPTVSACPLLWIRWEKLKKIKLKILAYSSWMFCVVTEFAYANTIILFNLGEKWLLEYSPPCFACRWIFCHYSPRFQRIIVK